MGIQRFIPPFLFDIKRQLSGNESSQVYSSYAEALAAVHGYGYEEPDLVEVIFQKTYRLRDQLRKQTEFSCSDSLNQTLIAVLMAIRSSGANPVCVLDLGGACGGHYYYVKNILKGRIDWLVVETPAMVGKAKILEEDGLTFSCNFSQALGETDKYHLMHSSGTIQYLPDPMRVLRDMIQRRADIFLLNRLMVAAQGESMILIQRSMLSANGPGSLPAGVVDRECRYPITCLAKRQIEDCIREEYDILLRFEDPTEYRIGGYPVRNVGYLAERR